jgi:DNA primase large subunit
MDERVQRSVVSLGRQSGKAAYKATTVEGEVTLAQLPSLATSSSFPMCMSKLYNALKTEHHLKHGGRMQFGLFLKGIGLSMNDSLAFWRSSFARRTPPEKFDKEYAYTIRHNYGKEGKRTNYTPYGCMKIIHSAPASGDHHGCPFKHSDEGSLKVTLRQRGLNTEGIAEVLTLVSNHHYQVACSRVFTLTHKGELPDGVGTHPNAYFEASQRLIATGGSDKDKEAVTGNSPGVAD